jgi:hypothetical protein
MNEVQFFQHSLELFGVCMHIMMMSESYIVSLWKLERTSIMTIPRVGVAPAAPAPSSLGKAN